MVQAVGRCTRSLQDYSAVVITGAELTDYLNSPTRIGFLHPELQAELDFGARQSTNTTLADMVDNFDIFIRNDAAWEAVNREILAKRDVATQQTHPGVPQLHAVVGREIDYQQALRGRQCWTSSSGINRSFAERLSSAMAVFSRWRSILWREERDCGDGNARAFAFCQCA